MNDLLNRVVFNNTIRDYLIVIGIILLVFLFKRYLSKYFAGLLFQLVKKIARGVDKAPFVNLVVQPLEIFLLIMVTMIALEKLSFPRVMRFEIYKVSFHVIIETASIIILLLTFTWLLLRIIDFIALILEQKADLTPEATDNQLVIFFKDFFKVIIIIGGLLLILKFAFQLHISSILTGLSIATAALALATRESLENLIGSFIIFFDKPFATGDLVKVQQVTGTVERIGLRSTRIRTTDKTFVTVPNKQMVDTILDNLSLRTHRRAELNLQLSPQTSHGQVNQLIPAIESLVKESSEVDISSVVLVDISKDAFVVQVEYFVMAGTQETFNRIRQEINLSIIRLLEQMKVRLASKETEIILRPAD